MTHGDEAADDAAARLRHLHEYFREHPVTGPEGHSYISSEPRATATAPGLPYNARVVEHIDRTVAEVAAFTRQVNPEAEPLPDSVLDTYRWCVENTTAAPEDVQQRRDTLKFRHSLELAIAAGDTGVVRPHRCPHCGTVGLHWDRNAQKAMCMNRHCARRNGGIHRKVSLSEIADLAVEIRKNLRTVSAT
jgi:hypothetical protein